ncbi:hypothetical protein FRC17_008198 [Serendipita sp. 399]|nr:hypothetical protein FRC17_008198 [Serendipita sp. 399]
MSDATRLREEAEPVIEDVPSTKEQEFGTPSAQEGELLNLTTSSSAVQAEQRSTKFTSTSTSAPSRAPGQDDRRKQSPPRGRGKPKRGGAPGRARSPGPPPLPPSFPPPPGYRRPFERGTSPPYRRGRSPEPPRRRTPPPPPPVPPSVPRPASFVRPRYGSPPRRGSPPSGPASTRRRNSRSRSPPPRHRSPPPLPGGRRRSPFPSARRRSPPPRRYSRSPPPARRYSRSPPPHRRRGGSPYSRGTSPSRRRSPIPSRSANRSPSPTGIRHRLPSPGRDRSRSLFASPTRSGQASGRASPARPRSPQRKRTRSPEKVEAPPTTGEEQDDSRFSKKRRTLDGSAMGQQEEEKPDVYMRGAQVKEEPKPVSLHGPVDRKSMLPPTEPRSIREGRLREAREAALRIKTEPRDIEMLDALPAGGSSPVMTATPSTPAPGARTATTTWRAGSVKPPTHMKQNSSVATPIENPNQMPPQGPPPPTPIQVTIPIMTNWRKDSVTPDLDAEIERIRQLRLHAVAEHNNIAIAVRRAMYELELADFDLRASEARLAVAEKQSDLALRGMLRYEEEV